MALTPEHAISPEPSLYELGMCTAQGLHYLSLSAGGGAEKVAGAFCWYSASYVPAFNGAAILGSDLLGEAHLGRLEEYFGARNRPYCFIVLDGLVPGALEALRSRGYYEYDSSPLMLLRGAPHRWADTPEKVGSRLVEQMPDLKKLRQIIGSVFHISPVEVDLILNGGVLGMPYVRHYLGLYGGRPVASATLVTSGPLSSIWNVGTLPDFRRKGISAELMHDAVGDALRLGSSHTMLLASAAGVPLYIRLGYNTVTRMRMLVPSRQPGTDF